MDQLIFYESYHQHPINKFIHFICIPIITYSILIFASHFYLKLTDVNKNIIVIRGDEAIVILYNFYYMSYGYPIGVYMFFYNVIIFLLSRLIYTFYPISHTTNLKIFLCAFMMQFIGHLIEGNQPALFTGLRQTLLQAPLHNVNYVYPIIP